MYQLRLVVGVFVLVVFGTYFVHGQRIIQKSFIDPEIKSISIDATNNFELTVNTSQSHEIILEASFDGEYSNDLFLNLRESGNTLLVSTDFSPTFENPNDKLSAHKVISVSLSVSLPENKRVTVSGRSCNVRAGGGYGQLNVILNDGNCELNQVYGPAEVTTLSGNISVTASEAIIEAESRYGELDENPIPSGGHSYELHTVTGNIVLNKTD